MGGGEAGAAEAPALARAYAVLCTTAFAPPVPLPWPRRTAGMPLRVVVLLPTRASDAAKAAIGRVARTPAWRLRSHARDPRTQGARRR
jgi:hypothetical protein